MHNPLKLHQSLRTTAFALTLFAPTFCSCLASSGEKPQDRLLTAATHAQLDAARLKPSHLNNKSETLRILS